MLINVRKRNKKTSNGLNESLKDHTKTPEDNFQASSVEAEMQDKLGMTMVDNVRANVAVDIENIGNGRQRFFI